MFPSIRECPLEWTTYLLHKRVNHYSDRTLAYVSYVNSVGSSVPQEDILACKSKGSVHTPPWSLRSDGREHGCRGIRAGPTGLSAARMANFRGNRYRRVPHAETDDVEVVACLSLRAHSVRVP